jgi:hypothetical protein
MVLPGPSKLVPMEEARSMARAKGTEMARSMRMAESPEPGTKGTARMAMEWSTNLARSYQGRWP